jgi:hypothetical protein
MKKLNENMNKKKNIDDSDKFKKRYNSDLNNSIIEDYSALYTLIWFDCYDCKELLIDVLDKMDKILYINGSYYFFDDCFVS